jgi:hypothetical protein
MAKDLADQDIAAFLVAVVAVQAEVMVEVADNHLIQHTIHMVEQEDHMVVEVVHHMTVVHLEEAMVQQVLFASYGQDLRDNFHQQV